MPWQLGRRQAGLLQAAGEKPSDRPQRPSERRKPLGGKKRPETGLGVRPATGFPPAILSEPAGRCPGLSGCAGLGCPAAPPNSDRPHLLRRESPASGGAPPPLPRARNRLAAAARLAAAVEDALAQLCAPACVSGTETTRAREGRPGPAPLGGGEGGAGAAGRWGGAGYFGPAPRRRHAQRAASWL